MAERGLILLAEDTQDDVLLIKRAFVKGGIKNPIYVVRDGDEAIAYLKGGGKFTNRDEFPLPDLMLLDLNMPKVSGFDVLRWARKQEWLTGLPILVLTSSDSLHDVNLAYKLGANSFLVKPLEFENCVQLGNLIQGYWLERSKAGQLYRPFPDSEADADMLDSEPKRRWHG